jgi:hypothetical protein
LIHLFFLLFLLNPSTLFNILSLFCHPHIFLCFHFFPFFNSIVIYSVFFAYPLFLYHSLSHVIHLWPSLFSFCAPFLIFPNSHLCF